MAAPAPSQMLALCYVLTHCTITVRGYKAKYSLPLNGSPDLKPLPFEASIFVPVWSFLTGLWQ